MPGIFAQMAAMVMMAVGAGVVTAASSAYAGHPPLVWMAGYVLAGTGALLAVALQAARGTAPKRAG